jgi:UPF0042 nucleotide-binding protein
MTAREKKSSTGNSLVLVTGMSGAGRTTALKSLEDLGYEAVDNLPLSLLGGLVRSGPEIGGTGPRRPLAIGVDIRTRDFGVDPFIDELDRLIGAAGLEVRTVFLDCDDEFLLRRYAETRRRHPLDSDRPVPDMIQIERRMLSRLRGRADVVIDTTGMSPWHLRERLREQFVGDSGVGMSLFVTSFGYRYGVPREADLVFDVRFLNNPHYDPALRNLTGEDPAVQEAVAADRDFDGFFESVTGLLEILLPRYAEEGKSYLTIAIGCTGGRHRSVFVATRLAEWLSANTWRVGVSHRDIDGGTDRIMSPT